MQAMPEISASSIAQSKPPSEPLNVEPMKKNDYSRNYHYDDRHNRSELFHTRSPLFRYYTF